MNSLKIVDFSWFCLLSVIFVSCGGPTPEAKMANAIQTLMSNTIEAFATKESGATEINFLCGDRSGEQGSFTYSVPPELDDPLNLITYLANPNAVVGFAVTFDNCVIRACGSEVILNGGTANLGMAVSTFLSASADSGEVPASFQLSVTDQTFEGLFSGTFSYSYIIEAIYTSTSLESIIIKDANPAQPLSTQGFTYTAEKIKDVADGC